MDNSHTTVPGEGVRVGFGNSLFGAWVVSYWVKGNNPPHVVGGVDLNFHLEFRIPVFLYLRLRGSKVTSPHFTYNTGETFHLRFGNALRWIFVGFGTPLLYPELPKARCRLSVPGSRRLHRFLFSRPSAVTWTSKVSSNR